MHASQDEIESPSAPPADQTPSRDEYEQKITELTSQLHEAQLRAAADLQNLSRRHQDELQAAYKFASQKLASDMLTVADYLEMALQDTSGQFDTLKTGVQMTLTELQKAFEKSQIIPIEPAIGTPLDPHQHQALQTEAAEQDDNTIVRVLKKGYMLSDRVLRAAMVVVAKQ